MRSKNQLNWLNHFKPYLLVDFICFKYKPIQILSSDIFILSTRSDILYIIIDKTFAIFERANAPNSSIIIWHLIFRQNDCFLIE